MDKRVIFAVAGSGKTTYIINNLNKNKRTLIVTYTQANCDNIKMRVLHKFQGEWPQNVTLMSYFSFLYNFCYKPFLSDIYGVKGIAYKSNPNRYLAQNNLMYYISESGYLYSNRISLLLEKENAVPDVKNRLMNYFDEFIIDEIQDIGGRDFRLLELLMESEMDMLFVGDFYQHTFDTSRDGPTNGKLFSEVNQYMGRFEKKGFVCDTNTLSGSWRCGEKICEFISDNLEINIESMKPTIDSGNIIFISDLGERQKILENDKIIKLHYQKATLHGLNHKNWGQTKGEDRYEDVCILLNKNTAQKYAQGKLKELPPSTKNKLYVALTRAKRNVYLMNE